VITYAVEPWSLVEAEILSLAPEHWAEIATDRDKRPVDLDLEFYRAFDLANRLHVCIVRSDGEMIGYHVAVIRRHTHRNILVAYADGYFVKKEFRKSMVGYRLIRFFTDTVPAEVDWLLMPSKEQNDIGRMLEHMGYKPVERIYAFMRS
jgi:hypothetical protein